MIPYTDIKQIISCSKTLPTLPSGETVQEVLEKAFAFQQDKNAQKEAGYAEFMQLFEQKVMEGLQYCGKQPSAKTSPPDTEEKSEKRLAAEATLARLERSMKYLNGEQSTH